MITPEHRVLFVQPLIHRYGIARAGALNDMLTNIGEKVDQTKECSLAMVASPAQPLATMLAHGTDDVLVKAVLCKMLLILVAHEHTTLRKNSGWTHGQIAAEADAATQYAKALAVEWNLVSGWEPDEIKGIPIEALTHVLKTINELAGENIVDLLKEFHNRKQPPTGKDGNAV